MRASSLLSFNPELQRNLWLELTPSRLVAAPVVLLLLLGGLSTIGGQSFAARIAGFLIWALLTLWGSRLAAESFGDEITGRTWDTQRLSAQTPWGLTLGKLFGGTAFVWYAAALCAGGLIVLQHRSAGPILGQAILGGLIAQSTALFVALAFNRFDSQNRRAHTALAQIIGIVAAWKSGLLLLPLSLPETILSNLITWYGRRFDGGDFFLVVQLMSVGWLVFGSMRIVRRELGLIDGPLGWLLYTLYAVVLAAGFVPMDLGASNASMIRFGVPLSILGAESLSFIAAVTLTYFAALGVPVSLIALKKLSIAIAARDWRGVWRNLPVWAPSFMVSALIVLFLAIRLAAYEITDRGALIPLAALGFLMRDIALITFLRLTYRQRTASALLVMFVLLYAVLPFALGHLSGGLLAPFFYPGLSEGIMGVTAPWAEAAIAFLAVRRIIRRPISAV